MQYHTLVRISDKVGKDCSSAQCWYPLHRRKQCGSFTSTRPNILALNFFPLLDQKILFFSLFAILALILTYIFHRATHSIIYDEVNTEGLYRAPKQASGWGLVFVSFALCVVYLPISTIAVHGLVSEWFVCIPDDKLTTRRCGPRISGRLKT